MSIEAARAWAELFIDRKNDEAWRALHSDTVDYFDHAYMIHRIGIEATVGVREVWLQCHDPLQVDIEVHLPTLTAKTPNLSSHL